MTPLLTATPSGLYCAAGDFHIDPAEPTTNTPGVARAVLTHAHGDHARRGHAHYYCAAPSLPLLQLRLAPAPDDIASPPPVIDAIPYGEQFSLDRARVSFHPSGHILGAAQIRIEVDGEVWVVSGDYKRAPDPTCAPFEVVRCGTFVTESTFGLPIYRWDAPESVMGEVWAWWEKNRAAGRAAILCCYALGKAQRILAGLMAHTDRTVLLHGAMTGMVACYRAAGVAMLPTAPALDEEPAKKSDKRARLVRKTFAGELVLAPPSAKGTAWLRRFGDCEIALASGHMQLRGTRRRRGFDRGFVLSDHADWPDLLRTVADTGARRVVVTHGHAEPFARHLRERGIDAEILALPAAPASPDHAADEDAP